MKRLGQRGAALLMAMLTVTLVATFAAASLWQQWRSVEVETAERARVQSTWVLCGALDWARLILREDARSNLNGPDHLAEPWAVPLQESRLSTFLAADRNNTAGNPDDAPEAFLSGQIIDLQSRMNVSNLIAGGKVSEPAMQAFQRLFELLNLPQQELATMAENLRRATVTSGAGDADNATPLLPQRVEQLSWLGLSPRTLQLLQSYVTVLPEATPVNLNTASAEVIAASIPGLDLADAQRLLAARARSHLRNLGDAATLLNLPAGRLNESGHDIKSRFFEVQGRLRLDQTTVGERSLVQRKDLEVTTRWRERMAAEVPR